MAVFVTPALILLAMFVVFCGRAAAAKIDVNAIAAAAARSAADAATPATARTAASQAAAAMAAGKPWTCTTATDTAAFRRGGSVTVNVACVIQLDDLGVSGLGATRTVRGSATAPIDIYREGT
jgi:Flp pilus assembly protein TadG